MLNIDPMNFCAVQLQARFDETSLSTATGFFYSGLIDDKPNKWLVTNWHVLTGRNALDPSRILHDKKAIPNKLRLNFPSNKDPSGKMEKDKIFFHEKFINIYNDKNQALWCQHPLKNQVDIAVLNLPVDYSEYLVSAINDLAQDDMKIEIGNEVFIIGYPLGFSHFANTPVWKHGCIASEPHAETDTSKNVIIIDATTRSGMSGSPVIMRSKTHYLSESGEIICYPNATRFIGVYASRPQANQNSDESDLRHELGYVYKSGLVPEVISKGIRGPDYGEMP